LPGYIVTEGPRIASLLLGFPLQASGINLSLLGVSAGTARAGFLGTRIELHLLSLLAHFGGLFAVSFVLFLLQSPAATTRHQKHDQKDHHNNANNHPNPRRHVQTAHLFHSLRSGLTDASQRSTRNPFETGYEGYLPFISNHAYYFTASIASS
jgi:hypothetical protein